MVNKLLLIGGGHAQLFVLEALRRRREEANRLVEATLITQARLTPYSGMLPGFVSGHYRSRECHVDLRPLAEAAGVRLVHAAIDRLDPLRRTASAGLRTWEYDLLSIDIGASVAVSGVPGAEGRAVPVRPVERFLHQWKRLLDQIDGVSGPLHGIVVGGGAGGVELLLAMSNRLDSYRDRMKWSLVTRGALLPGYSSAVVQRIEAHLLRAGVAVKTGLDVEHVADGSLVLSDGTEASFDALIWATGASPQPWIGTTGLATTEDGFLHVTPTLQSFGHPEVFAAGDIATDPSQPRPKAGVFAVRQGPVLADNLLRHAAGLPLRHFRAQHGYLSLLATGGRHAVASWHGLSWEGDWVWRWKDRIDRRFMQRFSPPFRI